ncbi:MAG: hypothetical protein AB8H79_26930 [Myxococcota bacterium]
MRWIIPCMAALVLAPQAFGAEVVYLTNELTPELKAAISEASKGSGKALTSADMLAATGQAVSADRKAYVNLGKKLKAVREFETRLDGELIIMADLERALADVEFVGSTEDRDKLFAALTYQGFAVHRFFEDTIGDDAQAEPYRVEVNGLHYVRPWAQALALEPQRDISPYEVAEAPQRIAYVSQKDTYGSEVLPGTLIVDDSGWLDKGATLYVDGRPVEGTDHRLLPGRHWAHLTLDGRVLDAGAVQIKPGQTTPWSIPQTPNGWRSWIRSVSIGQLTAPDAAVKEDVQALGGEVWFVVNGKGGPRINALAVSADGDPQWRSVDVPKMAGSGGRDSNDEDGLSVGVGVGGGWVYSGDFYTQNPLNVDYENKTVNAISTDLDVHVAYDKGLLRVAAGVHTAVVFGEDHAALTGDTATRFRPYFYAAAGLPWVQMSFGYLLPYHPTFGPQVTLPIWDDLELRGSFLFGIPTNLDPRNGADYKTQRYTSLTAGVAWRFR